MQRVAIDERTSHGNRGGRCRQHALHSKGAHARANPRSSKTDWGSVSPHYTLPPPSVFDLLATMAGLYGGEVRHG